MVISSTPLGMDRYTPFPSRPTEERTWRRANRRCQDTPHNCQDVLYHFSRAISLQETRIARLTHSFDLDLESDTSWDRMDVASSDTKSFYSTFGTPKQSAPSSPNMVYQTNRRHPIPRSIPILRPGRLSPTTMQMILSSNTSTVSTSSSAADTSYDSGLYQWLGVENHASRRESSPGITTFSTHDSLGVNTCTSDVSLMSAQSAYSQSPRSPVHFQTELPLSPPATTRPPFSNTLCREKNSASGALLSCLPNDIPSPHRNQLPFFELNVDHEAQDSATLHDFIAPILSNNLSLQHYMPSASVLRHFQRVVDELRGLYVPNDDANNIPNWHRNSRTSKRHTARSTRSLPGSYPSPPSRHGFTHQSSESPPNTLGSVTTVQNSDECIDTVVADHIGESRANRELYTEMAVVLFGQAAMEEAQIKDLRHLLERLELLVSRKRKVALILGIRGAQVGKD